MVCASSAASALDELATNLAMVIAPLWWAIMPLRKSLSKASPVAAESAVIWALLSIPSMAMLPRTIGRELRKLAYFAPRALALLVLSFIPVLNLAAAPLWLLFGVWMMAVQYIDYPADNNKLSWSDMMGWLRQRRWQSLSFGAVTYAALLVPVLNLLIMPAAVAGATLFWVREGGPNRQLDRQA